MTKCYIVDSGGYIVLDQDFLTVPVSDGDDYDDIHIGLKEGSLVDSLLYHQNPTPFTEVGYTNFQGLCQQNYWNASLLYPRTVQDYQVTDEYVIYEGPIPPYENDYMCAQDVIYFTIDSDLVASLGGTITGALNSACETGNYFFTLIPNSNAYLIVIENYQAFQSPWNLNCFVINSIYAAGAWEIANGTCQETTWVQPVSNVCPITRGVEVPCQPAAGSFVFPLLFLPGFITLVLIIALM